MEGLRGLVDGDHYFDTIADDAFFEFRYHFPGWPLTIRGGANRIASALRHTDRLLLRLALARLTFSRMSLAWAVQVKGLGWRLCSWM
jgi:hypothetical protein